MSSSAVDEVISVELHSAQELLSQHPVLRLSPTDLKHKGLDIDSYLKSDSLQGQDLYREYYDL